MKPIIIILTIISLGLGVGMLVEHQRANDKVKSLADENVRFSNQWQVATLKLDDVQQVAANLENTLNQRTASLAAASNELARTGADLAKVQTDFKVAQAEVEKQTARVTELEGQRDDLTKKMEDLTASIKSLENQIEDTKKKLASAEGDRQVLSNELKRLQDEKSVLVAQFNDLAALRAQVAKLKEEAAIGQRIAWIKAGVYSARDKKGAERLLSSPFLTAVTPDNRLDIELRQSGGDKAAPASPPPKQ